MSEAEALALEEKAEHRYANSNGVKIHYALYGSGPLVVFLHGFPDYWLTWRHQMLALSKSFRSAALDMRGYNLSDKPKGVENYNINRLVDDAAAVIADQGEKARSSSATTGAAPPPGTSRCGGRNLSRSSPSSTCRTPIRSRASSRPMPSR